jgi:hypothetical protein
MVLQFSRDVVNSANCEGADFYVRELDDSAASDRFLRVVLAAHLASKKVKFWINGCTKAKWWGKPDRRSTTSISPASVSHAQARVSVGGYIRTEMIAAMGGRSPNRSVTITSSATSISGQSHARRRCSRCRRSRARSGPLLSMLQRLLSARGVRHRMSAHGSHSRSRRSMS